jgi:hypothetical protein
VYCFDPSIIPVVTPGTSLRKFVVRFGIHSQQ